MIRQKQTLLKTSLGVIVINIFVCFIVGLIGYLAFFRLSLAPDASSSDNNVYFTWEIPGFAYMCNQILLHVMAPLYHPVPQRKLVSPGFRFPKIQGAQEETYLAFEDVFQVTPELKQRFVFPTPKSLLPSTASSSHEDDEGPKFLDIQALGQSSQEPFRSAQALRILGKTEEFWKSMFYRFNTLGAIFLSSDITRSRNWLQFREPIPSIVANASAANNRRLRKAIAIHLRFWEKSVSLNIPDVCAQTIPWYHPFRYWYSCYTKTEWVSGLIDQVQTSRDQPIFIATDHKDHDVISDLKKKYGSRIFFTDDIIQWDAIDYGKDSKLNKKSIPALVENELLSEGEILIGNYWSTYTTLAAVKKGSQVYYIRDPTERTITVFVLLLLVVLVEIGLYFALKCFLNRFPKWCKNFRNKKHEKKTSKL